MAPMAASLHALIHACTPGGGGQIKCRDVLMLFTSIMASMCGSEAMSDFLVTSSAAEAESMQSSIFSSVRKDFDRLYREQDRATGAPTNSSRLLYGSFRKLLIPRSAAGLRGDKLQQLMHRSNLPNAYCRLTEVPDAAGMTDRINEMRTRGYFDIPAWGQLVTGRALEAERLSWQLLRGEQAQVLCAKKKEPSKVYKHTKKKSCMSVCPLSVLGAWVPPMSLFIFYIFYFIFLFKLKK